MTVWLDGDWLGDGAAVIAAGDRGLLLGDGLFETLRFSGGRLLRQAAHEQRLRASCAALDLACPLDRIALAAIVGEMAARAGLRQAAIRLTLTAGAGQRGLARPAMTQPSCLITAAPLPEVPASLSLATVAQRRSVSSIAARHKTLSYIDNAMARREAVRSGAGMALLLDTDGHVSGTDCANLFWMREGRLFTPALECAVLPGTVRGAIIAALDVEQGRFTPEDLALAQGVFVTNALLGAVAVSGIDGAPAGAGQGVPDAVRAVLD
ncbi:aminotransferase class IV [uncultured Maricaulis sp.]|uniref:aminotransferase class IV n=1 Tax=uncultured Maricaulis sp. TaxID=174710 RepID=UPI0030D79545|tara:strand:+ start:63474 stop:64271 length:798 start_codon:yes stop_codon:yes gene_type:complete